MNHFPEFGAELKRSFEVNDHERSCYDCAEFFGPGHETQGCNARPADPKKSFDCLDFLLLPVAGNQGQTGQVFPPSKMKGRTEPQIQPKDGTAC